MSFSLSRLSGNKTFVVFFLSKTVTCQLGWENLGEKTKYSIQFIVCLWLPLPITESIDLKGVVGLGVKFPISEVSKPKNFGTKSKVNLN